MFFNPDPQLAGRGRKGREEAGREGRRDRRNILSVHQLVMRERGGQGKELEKRKEGRGFCTCLSFA